MRQPRSRPAIRPLLEATGDLLDTGLTGTNVGDIVLALRCPPAFSPAM